MGSDSEGSTGVRKVIARPKHYRVRTKVNRNDCLVSEGRRWFALGHDLSIFRICPKCESQHCIVALCNVLSMVRVGVEDAVDA